MAARTFKVESKRSDKSFPMTSIQLSQFVGGELNEAFPHIQADMHTPEVVVHVEVRVLPPMSTPTPPGARRTAGGGRGDRRLPALWRGSTAPWPPG